MVDPWKLMAELMYGAGLRLLETCRLRVKDLDFDRRQILVREGKGDKDRAVPLPNILELRLRDQIAAVSRLHARDVAQGLGRVYLPHALAEKYPAADRQLSWQYLFPSSRLSRDPRAKNRSDTNYSNYSPRLRDGFDRNRHPSHGHRAPRRAGSAAARG